jgi:hypothetical protein
MQIIDAKQIEPNNKDTHQDSSFVGFRVLMQKQIQPNNKGHTHQDSNVVGK